MPKSEECVSVVFDWYTLAKSVGGVSFAFFLP